jgi:hypothetical protein
MGQYDRIAVVREEKVFASLGTKVHVSCPKWEIFTIGSELQDFLDEKDVNGQTVR